MGISVKKISVIIRAYNCEKYVIKSVESALNQTLNKKLYEIVVINDGSTDNTLNILKKYQSRIKLINQGNKGCINAAGIGVENSEGEFIIFLDADDYYEKNILKELLDGIKNTNCDFAYCDYFEKDINKNETKIVSLKENIFNALTGGILIKKKIFLEFGGYDDSMNFPEYDLLIKMINKYKGIYIEKPLFTYLRHEKSITSNKEFVRKGFEQLKSKYPNLDIKKIRSY